MTQGGGRRKSPYIILIILMVVLFGAAILWAARQAITQNVALNLEPFVVTEAQKNTPATTATVLAAGRDHVWDLAFLPGGELIFTERQGTVSLMDPEKNIRKLLDVPNINAVGEGGLMGLAVDPDFDQNSYIYACFNYKSGSALDVRVARWTLNPQKSALENQINIVTGIDANPSGRHSGCRLAFGPDVILWIGTGDAATGGTPQDPQSLGGKILRVNRDGSPAQGNLAPPFDPRIYSYGHRNTQGIAFFDSVRDGASGLSAEHGSTVDDELNLLKPGNFGWDPAAGSYNETGLPMTDLGRFPDAVPSVWSSGSPTQAPSGIAIIKGSKWQSWEGAVAMAMLKAGHLKILQLEAGGLKVAKEEKILLSFGRLRAVAQGPDGSLFISTDNGQNDQIIRLSPG